MFRAVFPLDDWQEVVRSCLLIFVQETLYLGLDVYAYLLSCLAPRIGNKALPDVCLSQIGEVYGSDAPQAERKKEHIAGEVKRRGMAQFCTPDPLDDIECQGTLCRLVYPCIDGTEWMAVGGKPFGNGLVVD